MITLLSNIQQEPFGNILDKIIMLKRTLFLVISLLWAVNAFALTISPDKAVVAIGQRLTLSVSDAVGEVRWQAFDGTITGTGNQVNYIPPSRAGLDTVTVKDNKGSVTIDIVVTQPQTEIKAENAIWEVFYVRNEIRALSLSEDSKILWVGTDSGLEQRDAATGYLIKVYTNTDGLPTNSITKLLSDSRGIWIGTDEGLILREPSGNWKIFDNYKTTITSLALDKQGNLWVGAEGALLQYTIDDKWEIFNNRKQLVNISDSSNGYLSVSSIIVDDNGGIWIGSFGSKLFDLGAGLIHRDVNGLWKEFDLRPYISNFFEWNFEFHVSMLYTDNNGDLLIGISTDLSKPNELRWMSISKDMGIIKQNNDNLDLRFNFTTIEDVLPTTITLNNDKEFWVATSKGDVIHYQDGKVDKPFSLSRGDASAVPNHIEKMFIDDNHYLWVVSGHGVFVKDTGDKWKHVTLPTNAGVCCFASDRNGGIWIGTGDGLLHYLNGKWEIFSTSNSTLPRNSISSISVDLTGGVWIGTGDLRHLNLGFDGGFTYRDSDGKWTVYRDDNDSPNLPRSTISHSSIDSVGKIWVAAHWPNSSERLAYRHQDDTKWNVLDINFANNDAKYGIYEFNKLLADARGGIWIASNLGLIYKDANDKFYLFDNPELKSIQDLFQDSKGGLWLGTAEGLIHRSESGEITIFNKRNSALPFDQISSLALIGDSLWIGTTNLARLIFDNKNILCQQSTQQDCNTLQNNKRSAILISGGGSQSDNLLWDTTYNISNNIYKTLSKRGFDNDEIYYLSPVADADFNGDGFDDRIVDAPNVGFIDNNNDGINDRVDRPLESADVQNALNWAKQRGKLDQPLYIFFIDHGGADKFQLSKDNLLDVEQFRQMLDGYQTETGNEVVLVIDACFSGVLGEKLKADKRAIITSTNNSYAYFNRLSKQGFSSFLTKGLSKGMNFNEAFTYATEEQKKLLGNLDLRVAVTGDTQSTAQEIQQVPQKYDQNQTYSLDKLFLNGGFVTGDATLAVKSLTPSTTLKANTSFQFKAQATVAQGKVQQVWAVVRPPRIDLLLDSYNTPILAYPREILTPTTDNEWQGIWTDTRYNGEYKITFYAKDKEGDVVSSDETVILTVTDGIDPPKTANTQIQLNQLSYKIGDILKATVTEELQWGYDLYLAVILPSGDFITVKEKNNFSSPNKAEVWRGKRQQGIANPFLELSLPTLPRGQYCLLSVLSPQGESVMNMTEFWKQSQQCIEIN